MELKDENTSLTIPHPSVLLCLRDGDMIPGSMYSPLWGPSVERFRRLEGYRSGSRSLSGLLLPAAVLLPGLEREGGREECGGDPRGERGRYFIFWGRVITAWLSPRSEFQTLGCRIRAPRSVSLPLSLPFVSPPERGRQDAGSLAR